MTNETRSSDRPSESSASRARPSTRLRSFAHAFASGGAVPATRAMLLATFAAASVAAPAALAGESGPAGAPPPGAASLLAGRALGATPLIDDLRELCDRIGGRPTGSEACVRAEEWAAGRLRSAGAASVRLEAFEMPSLWLGGSAEMEVTSPERFAIRVVASPQTASTPGASGIEAKIVLAGRGAPDEFDSLGAKARGAIAVVATDEMLTFESLFEEYMRDKAMLEAAGRAGVAAIVLQSTRPRGLLYRHPASLAGAIAPIPVAVASREGAARLIRLAGAGEASARLRLANRTGGPYHARNVVGEIRGRERPGEIVLLGAHLDSWDLGTGEEDNGVNVALVIDVARGLAGLGLAPRRTIRFVLFTGEEQGLFGSRAYVSAHASEMDDHVAAVVFDTGSGRTDGFLLSGRDGWRAFLDAALAPVSALGPFAHTPDAIVGTDNFDFLLAGVPNLVANQDAIPYLPDYHAESDVFEHVNEREARASVAIASAVVWALAEAPERPLPRQSRAEVEALIQATGLEAQMVAFDQWDDWAAGRRWTKGPTSPR